MDLARLPWAVWDPIADRDKKAQSPIRMTVHTAWVDSADIYGPRRGQGSTYAHVYNPLEGALRQHQELNRMSRADLDGNGLTVSVENQDERREMPFSDSQLENMARLFAELVNAPGSRVPNRIATVDDTRGLAWHRLGVLGNFGRYNPDDITTWCAHQTGERWTTARGKTCPTNPRIRQIPEIWKRAQKYIEGADEYRVGGLTVDPSKPPTYLEVLTAMNVYVLFQAGGTLAAPAGEYVANLLDGTYRRFPNDDVKNQFVAQLDNHKVPWAWHQSTDKTNPKFVAEPRVFGKEVQWA